MPLDSVFSAASPSAHRITDLFLWMLLMAGGIFTIVAGSLTLILLRFRARPGQLDPPQQYGVRWVEIVWTVTPLTVLIIVFVFTIRVMIATEPSRAVGDATAPDLVIVGHQWWWEARYPKAGLLTANEIHLPAGARWLVRIESGDVIHDFWVPALGPKIDAVPGHPNYLWLQSDAPGVYFGTCSEYCGVEHAWMRIRVVAEAPADFDRWLTQQNAISVSPDATEADRGARIFAQRTCVNCHRIAGTGATASVGPDLTHVASRTTLGAGVLDNTPVNLSAWLRNPQSIKPGARMPDLHLSPDDVQALTAYLESLH
jgi:cytochrome c oxidase subunit 2